MKEINLNKESKSARWYRFFYGIDDYKRSMPMDTCSYYRNSILSWLLAPFGIIGIIWSAIAKDKTSWWEKIILTVCFFIMPLFFGALWYDTKDILNHSYIEIWLYGILSFVLFAISTIIAILIGVGIGELRNYYNSKKSQSKEPKIVNSWYKQLKEKTCNKINWN